MMEGYGKSFIIIRFDIAVANVGVAAQVTSRFNDQSFKVERNVCPLMKKVIALEGVCLRGERPKQAGTQKKPNDKGKRLLLPWPLRVSCAGKTADDRYSILSYWIKSKRLVYKHLKGNASDEQTKGNEQIGPRHGWTRSANGKKDNRAGRKINSYWEEKRMNGEKKETFGRRNTAKWIEEFVHQELRRPLASTSLPIFFCSLEKSP